MADNISKILTSHLVTCPVYQIRVYKYYQNDYFLIRQSPDSQLNHCFPVLVLKMKTSQTLNAPIENSTNELNRVAALARISHPLLTRLIMMMYLRRKTRLGPRAIFSNCWISAESYAAPSNGALRNDFVQ